jgi:hypothetical protein
MSTLLLRAICINVMYLAYKIFEPKDESKQKI